MYSGIHNLERAHYTSNNYYISKKWAFEFTLIIIDIKRFLTQGSENIKLYTGYAGYSKRFGVLHHHQLNMIDLYEALVEVIYRRIR